MEVSPNIIQEIGKVEISIVVSHCKSNIEWIKNYIGNNYSIKEITIYSKCDKDVEGLLELEKLSPTVAVIKMPNVGRCDHTFAHWINSHYESIEKERDGNDIVMFLKDNGRHQSEYLPIDELFSHVSNTGFGCVVKPTSVCGKEEGINDMLVPTMQHTRRFLEIFSSSEYRRLKRDNNSHFVSEKYADLKSWEEDMGFVIPESETLPICFRGLFAAQKKQFLNQAKTSWEQMELSLSRGDNIVESHYAERLWAPILSDIDDESARAVDKVFSQYAVKDCSQNIISKHEDPTQITSTGQYSHD